MNRKTMHGFGILVLLACCWGAALSGCTMKDYFGRDHFSGPGVSDDSEIRKCIAGIRPHESPDQYYRRGRYLQKADRHVQAVREFQTAAALNPGYADAFNAMGISLDSLGRFVEATDAYRKAIEIDPDRADILNNLGWSALLRKDPGTAVGYFRGAVSIDGKNRRYCNNLGMAHAKMGNIDEALASFMTTGDEADSRSRLARILAENGYEDEAKNQLRLAAALKASPPALTPPPVASALPAQASLPAQYAMPVAVKPSDSPKEVEVAPNPSSGQIIEEFVAAGPTTFEIISETDPLPGVSVMDGNTASSSPRVQILEISNIEPPRITILPVPEPSDSPADLESPSEPVAPPDVKIPPIPHHGNIAAVTVPEPAAESPQTAAPVVGIEITGPDRLRALIRRMEKKLARPGFDIRRTACAETSCSGTTIVYYCEGFLYDAWDVAKVIPGWQNMKKVKEFEKSPVKVRATLGRDLIKP